MIHASRLLRLVLLALAATAVWCATAAAGGTAKAKPAFKFLPHATHGVVPQITRGPDGRMWFPESFADQIGAITNGGKVSHYRAGAKGYQPNTIVAAPDGKLWYTL